MAVELQHAGTDGIDHTHNEKSMPEAGTIAIWMHPTAWADRDVFVSKGTLHPVLNIKRVIGAFAQGQFSWSRATTAFAYQSSGAIMEIDAWHFFACTYDIAGGSCDFWFRKVGDANVTKSAGTGTNGSGAVNLSTDPLMVGASRSGGTGTVEKTIGGHYGAFYTFDVEFTQEQVEQQSWQLMPIDFSSCKLFTRYGHTTDLGADSQADIGPLAIAHAEVVGTTQAINYDQGHVPLPWWGKSRRGVGKLLASASRVPTSGAFVSPGVAV